MYQKWPEECDNLSEKLDFGGKQGAPLWQPVVFKPPKHFPQVPEMFLIALSEHQDVIQEGQDSFLRQPLEDQVHGLLKWALQNPKLFCWYWYRPKRLMRAVFSLSLM